MPIEIYAALLGVFVGGFITYYFSFKLAKCQQRIVAAANFRASFSYTVSQMAIAQSDKSINVEALLTETFPDLAAAIETYRPFVASKNKVAYQEAWDTYHKVGGGIRFFDYYMVSEGPTPYELFTTRIENILKHAPL